MNKNNTSSPRQFFINHQNKINFLINLLLVFIFAFLAWQNENRFFAIFIIFFFGVASIFQKQRYFVLIIAPLIIFILFNTLTLDSFRILTKSDLPAIQHPKAELSNLFTPNSGQGVLPPQVLTMITVLDENNAKTYKLSEKFRGDVVIYQRIVEGAWPIRLDETSSFTLISNEEVNEYKDCLVLDQKEDVILVDCH